MIDIDNDFYTDFNYATENQGYNCPSCLLTFDSA